MSRVGRSGVHWLMVLVGLAAAGPQTASGQDPSVQEIMRRNFFVSRVGDSRADAAMTLINEAGQQRVRRLFSMTKLKEDGASQMRVARFLYPPDIRGTATLMIENAGRDDDMWVYLPALGKVRRLVSKNKGDSYLGTDFSYGDIMGHRVEDYTHRLLGSEVIGGVECFVVESIPVSDRVRRDGGYGKRISWIRKDSFVSLKEEGYDLQGKLFKRFTAADLRLVDPQLARWQPLRMEMVNLESRHRTVLSYEDFKANVGVEQTAFTTAYLERQF